jgi:hypothetical protein
MPKGQDGQTPVAPDLLMQLATDGFFSRALFCVTRLGIADSLGAGRKTADELGAAVRANPRTLRRLLRALCAIGVFDEDESGAFGVTTLGEPLRGDDPRSVRQGILFFTQDVVHRALGELLAGTQTGEPPFRRAFGTDAFTYLAADPEASRIMQDGMESETRAVARAVVAAYDFSPCRTIVDVGGGTGVLLAAILRAAPTARGILGEVPSVIPVARERLAGAGVGDRCALEPIDMLHAVPAGGDLYVLKSVIHDWNDDVARTILRNCRDVAARDARLVLVERVMPERLDASPRTRQLALADLVLLVVTEGRERSEAEYAALLAASGWRLQRVVPTRLPLSVLEAIAA